MNRLMTDTDRAAWLEERRSGVGGSDAAAIAGLHPYKSAWSVYHDKVGTPGGDTDSEAAMWGRILEDAIAAEWYRRHGTTGTALVNSGLCYHPDHSWWIGTPDRLIVDVSHAAVPAAKAVVECKNVGHFAWIHQWDSGHTIPPWIEVQCHWYLELVDVDVCHLAVLVGGSRLETRDVHRDPAVVERLTRMGQRFWQQVVDRDPPPPDGGANTRHELDDLYPPPPDRTTTVLPADAAVLVERYGQWREASRHARDQLDTLGNRLVMLLGEHGATDGFLPGQDHPAVTYRPTNILDVDKVAADYPNLAKAAEKVTYDVKALRQMLGREAADYSTPTGPRRLNVRDIDTEQEN